MTSILNIDLMRVLAVNAKPGGIAVPRNARTLHGQCPVKRAFSNNISRAGAVTTVGVFVSVRYRSRF